MQEPASSRVARRRGALEALEIADPQHHRSIAFIAVSLGVVLGAAVGWAMFAAWALATAGVRSANMALAVVTAPFVSYFAFRAVQRLWRRMLRLRRVGSALTGLGRNIELPLDQGRITCRARMTSGKHRELRFVVAHEARGGTTELFDRCVDPVETRSAAEAICKVGGYSMMWVPLQGTADVRDFSELDQPYVERALSNPELLKPRTPPRTLRYRYMATADGVRLVSKPLSLRALLTMCGWSIAGAAGLGAIAYASEEDAGLPLPTLALAFTALFVGVSCLFWLYHLLVPEELVATTRGVERTLKIFRVFTARWEVPSARLESLLVEGETSCRLVFVGDGFQRVAGRFDSFEEARFARQQLLFGLLGESRREDRQALDAAS